MTTKTILHRSPNRSPKNARVFPRSSSHEIHHDDHDEVPDDIRKMLDEDISSLEHYGRALVFTSDTARGKKLFHSLLRFGVYSDVARSAEKFIEFFVYALSRRPYDFVVFDPLLSELIRKKLQAMIAGIQGHTTKSV